MQSFIIRKVYTYMHNDLNYGMQIVAFYQEWNNSGR